MQKVNFKVADAKYLDVNDDRFQIFRSDTDVLIEAVELEKLFAPFAHIADLKDASSIDTDMTDSIVLALDGIKRAIDSMLGEGALEIITKGQSVGILPLIGLYKDIVTAIVQTYAKDIDTKYE